ncbi:hypothetical protein KEM52_002125 [Ascosphaera acerosa]|nr:hypothetical protein KEM52_002125 [Ascosphaera acerosa]
MSTTSTTHAPTFVVLGAGVVGLTTACELARRMPDSKITVVAKHFPGDIDPTEYCSPQAGANWASFEEEYNQRAQYDERSFRRFTALMREHPDCGVEAAPLRMVYGSSRRGGGDGDEDKDEPRPPKPWYAELLRFRQLARGALPEGADYGYEGTSLVINTAVYLSWYGGLAAGVVLLV